MLQPTIGQTVHIMASGDAVQNVRLKHGIEGDTAQLNTVILQDAAIVLEVLPHFAHFFIFQQRLQQFQSTLAGDLIRSVQIIMRDRYIRGNARFDGKREAHQVGGDIIQAVGLRVESKNWRFFQLFNPAFQRNVVQNRDIIFIRERRCRFAGRFINNDRFLRFGRRFRALCL